MSIDFEWNGDAISHLMSEAMDDFVIEVGSQIAHLAKDIVHVETGTLKRSLHVAALDEDHSMDQALAHGFGPEIDRPPGVYLSGIPGSTVGIDLQETRGAALRDRDVDFGTFAEVEVGSWVDYACVEETGRHHYYLHPAVEMILPTGWATLEAQVRAKGL